MPPFGGQLPAYQYPGNAMINFQPVSDALDKYQQGQIVAGESTAKINAANAMKAGDYSGAAGELAKVDPRAAMEMGQFPGKLEAQQNELRMQTAKLLGGHAQTILDIKDPDAQRQAASKWLSSDPKFAQGLGKLGIPDWQADPVGSVKAIHAEALGAQDPEHQALMRAQAGKASVLEQPPGGTAVNINPDRGRVGEVISSTGMKPPPGYEADPANPGQFRPMIGGPADIKFTEAKQKALASAQSTTANLDNLTQNIDALIKHPGLGGNFGLTGVLPNIPGGNAADARALLDQLRAQGGFSSLQAMRDASKTGGALGSVSDAEGIRLENAFAALQKAQSETQVRSQLENVKRITQESKARIQAAYDRQYGSTTPAETPTRQAPGTVANGPATGPTTAKPNTARLPAGVDAAEALSQARAAIAGGKDPNLIKQRLQQLGIDPGQL